MERIVSGRSGDTLVVPRGIKHIAFNDRDEALVCIVEYKPGLDLYKTLQCFAGLTIDRDFNGRGLVNIPKIMYMLKKADARSHHPPRLCAAMVVPIGHGCFLRIWLDAGMGSVV